MSIQQICAFFGEKKQSEKKSGRFSKTSKNSGKFTENFVFSSNLFN